MIRTRRFGDILLEIDSSQQQIRVEIPAESTDLSEAPRSTTQSGVELLDADSRTAQLHPSVAAAMKSWSWTPRMVPFLAAYHECGRETAYK